MITQDQLIGIAWQAVRGFEQIRSYDVFDVVGSTVTFQDDRGLFKVRLSQNETMSYDSAKRVINNRLTTRISD